MIYFIFFVFVINITTYHYDINVEMYMIWFQPYSSNYNIYCIKMVYFLVV